MTSKENLFFPGRVFKLLCVWRSEFGDFRGLFDASLSNIRVHKVISIMVTNLDIGENISFLGKQKI